jgi:hypothetical protein
LNRFPVFDAPTGPAVRAFDKDQLRDDL